MNISEVYDDLFLYEHTLRQAEEEYHEYVRQAAWSDEICYRVDSLKEVISTCSLGIATIKAFLQEI